VFLNEDDDDDDDDDEESITVRMPKITSQSSVGEDDPYEIVVREGWNETNATLEC